MSKYPLATAQANRVIRDLKISTDRKVNLDVVLVHYDIVLKRVVLKEGIDGAFKTKGLDKLIVINSLIDTPSRVRFTIGHELGHILLCHSPMICRSSIHVWAKGLPDFEKEANQFAADLLLPREGIRQLLSINGLSIKLLKETADNYEASLIASAIQVFDLSQELAFILFHDRKNVKSSIKTGYVQFSIKESGIIDNNIIDQIENIDNARDYAEGNINSDIWLEDDIAEKYTCFQQTYYFRRRKEYITLLLFEEQ